MSNASKMRGDGILLSLCGIMKQPHRSCCLEVNGEIWRPGEDWAEFIGDHEAVGQSGLRSLVEPYFIDQF